MFCFCVVGDDDPAIEALSRHFKAVIEQVVADTYHELPPKDDIVQSLSRPKKFFFNLEDCASLWYNPAEVRADFAGSQTVANCAGTYRVKIIDSFKR